MYLLQIDSIKQRSYPVVFIWLLVRLRYCAVFGGPEFAALGIHMRNRFIRRTESKPAMDRIKRISGCSLEVKELQYDT